MTNPTPLGSDAWIGADRYNNAYTKRIVDFMNALNEQALQAYASRLRDHRPCTLSDKFSVGTTNLVRKLQFNDGVEWIARLRMPPSEGNTLDKEKALTEMQCELDTMEFVRQKTEIPIPKVYGYDLSDQNAVGCPFTLMEFVEGNTAEELSRNFPGDHDGIPEKFQDKFWRQIAWVMIQLASVRVLKIGSLYRDIANRDAFTVGPLVETGSGPYDSVAHFYDDYPLALDTSLRINHMEEVEGQGALLRYFKELAKSFPQATTSRTGNDRGELGGFGLLNGDLGPNNVLVDHEFKVLAVIDWDDVLSVPDTALYRIPAFMGIDLGIPGRFSKTNPASMKRLQLCRRFVDVVEDVAKRGLPVLFGGQSRVRGPQRLFTFQRTKFFCKEALAFRSLTAATFKQKHANERWLEGLRWLSEHDEKTVGQFYVEDD